MKIDPVCTTQSNIEKSNSMFTESMYTPQDSGTNKEKGGRYGACSRYIQRYENVQEESLLDMNECKLPAA